MAASPATILAHATPLPPITDPSFGAHFSKFSNCRILLLGDASHGTSEFYAARAKITQYMILHHGFNIVAVEADWPDAEAIDRYVRRRPGPKSDLTTTPADKKKEVAFTRFPTWMWRNQEVHDFVEWLRAYNDTLAQDGPIGNGKAGFYGLDLYSMGASIRAVIEYLDNVDHSMAQVARNRYGGLQPWVEHPEEYGLGALVGAFESCEEEVLKMLKELLGKRLEYAAQHKDGEEFHSAEQNARLIAGTSLNGPRPIFLLLSFVFCL